MKKKIAVALSRRGASDAMKENRSEPLPSMRIALYRMWLLENVGIKPAQPDAIVRNAQKRYGTAFATWLQSFS